MQIKVLVLGPPDLVDMTMELGKQMDDFIMEKAIYSEPTEVVELIHQYQHLGDILLFAAPLPYLIFQDYLKRGEMELKKLKPMIFVPYTEASIYHVLFRMLKELRSDPNDPITFSIDYPAEPEVRECLEELEISMDQTFARECSFDQDLEELRDFHYNLWKQKRIQVAMTSFYQIHQELQKLGVPSYRITPAKISIRNTLQRALWEGKSLCQAESQIAIGIIGLNHGSRNQISEYQMKRRKLALQQLLLDYGENIHSLIDWSDHGEIRFITTRGEMVRSTDDFQKILILQDIQDKLNLSAYMGIGFGRTANEAEIKAYEALSKAKSNGSGSCFVAELDGNVHGPIGKESQLQYSVKSDDPELLSIAKKAELSIATINKLISLIRSYDSPSITAVNLASGFGITLRSARRILNKLEMAHFAKITGEEQPFSKGRPRQIYTLYLKNGT